jgi:hypothetical protein
MKTTWPAIWLCAMGGCVSKLGEEHLGTDLAGRAEPACVSAPADATLAQGGGIPLSFAGGTYFVYGETVHNPTSALPGFQGSSGAVLARGAGPCDAPTVVRDASGAPAEILPLTAEEAAAAPTIRLWPVSGFVSGDVATIYYEKIRLRSYLDFDVLGVGVAHATLGGIATRAMPGAWPDEPTLLWRAPAQGWGHGAFVAEDGMAYVYGCFRRGAFDEPCRLARVDPARADDPGAYTYWDGTRYGVGVDSAVDVLAANGSISVAWNAHLGAYLALHGGLYSNDVVAELAPRPEGPWSHPELLFSGDPPAQFWISGVRQLPAFGDATGQTVAVGYDSSPAAGPSGTRWVRYVLP